MMKRLILSLFLCSACFAQYNGVKPMLGTLIGDHDPSLAALYALNENSGGLVNDLSGNKNHGTITGATWTGGRFGTCLSLAEGNYIDCGNGPTVQFGAGDWTLSMWVLATSAANVNTLWDKKDIYAAGVWVRLTATTGIVLVEIEQTDGTRARTDGLGTKNAADGQWHNVVVVRTAALLRQYIDGVLDASVSASAVGDITAAGENLIIGMHEEGSSGFVGLVDLPIVWLRALTPTEIQRLYWDQFEAIQRDRPELYVATGAPPATYRRRTVIAREVDAALWACLCPVGLIFTLAVAFSRTKKG